MVLFFALLSVSVDAYVAGLAYNIGRKMTFCQTLYAGTFTLIACLLVSALSAKIIFFQNYAEIIGGAILFIIGVRYILDWFFENNDVTSNKGITALGIAVSLDAAAAVLALPSVNAIAGSILLFIFHTVFLYLSALTVKPIGIFRGLTLISGVFLTLFGIYRMI